MKKDANRVFRIGISIILTIILSFCLCACNNNYKDEIDEQSVKIEQLEKCIDELNEQIERLNETIAVLNGVSESLVEELRDKTEKIKILQESIDNLRGKPIEFTASEPLYGPNPGLKTFVEFNVGMYPSFDDFIDYYRENVQDKVNGNMFAFRPLDYYDDPIDNGPKAYVVQYSDINDGMLVEPMILQYMWMYSPVLGDNDSDFYRYYDGHRPNSLYLRMFLVPTALPNINKINLAEFELEFGNNGEENVGKTYINIYIEKICIGTCYYDTTNYISHNWFLNYFRNSIVGCSI